MIELRDDMSEELKVKITLTLALIEALNMNAKEATEYLMGCGLSPTAMTRHALWLDVAEHVYPYTKSLMIQASRRANRA
jgi:hypothetical protein